MCQEARQGDWSSLCTQTAWLDKLHTSCHNMLWYCLQVVIMADGQVTRGNEIVKPNVTKVRRLNDSVISGFAGI